MSFNFFKNSNQTLFTLLLISSLDLYPQESRDLFSTRSTENSTTKEEVLKLGTELASLFNNILANDKAYGIFSRFVHRFFDKPADVFSFLASRPVSNELSCHVMYDVADHLQETLDGYSMRFRRTKDRPNTREARQFPAEPVSAEEFRNYMLNVRDYFKGLDELISAAKNKQPFPVFNVSGMGQNGPIENVAGKDFVLLKIAVAASLRTRISDLILLMYRS